MALSTSQLETLATRIPDAFAARDIKLPLNLGAAAVFTRAIILPTQPERWIGQENPTPEIQAVLEVASQLIEGLEK